MLNEAEIDLTDPGEILRAVAEELFDQGLVASFEPVRAGAEREDHAWSVYQCSDDAVKITVALYSAGELERGSQPGWEVSAEFESARPGGYVQSFSGETLSGFVEIVRSALSK